MGDTAYLKISLTFKRFKVIIIDGGHSLLEGIFNMQEVQRHYHRWGHSILETIFNMQEVQRHYHRLGHSRLGDIFNMQEVQRHYHRWGTQHTLRNLSHARGSKSLSPMGTQLT